MLALYVIGVVVLGLLCFKWWWQHENEKMIRDFEAKFPGRCIMCSFDRYSAMFERGPIKPHTYCTERVVSKRSEGDGG